MINLAEKLMNTKKIIQILTGTGKMDQEIFYLQIVTGQY